MKQSLFYRSLATSLAIFYGCSSSSQPNVNPPLNMDPVFLAALDQRVYTFENGQKFDAGIGFFRYEEPDSIGPDQYEPGVRMSFEMNGNPVQVGNVSVNGKQLQWNSSGNFANIWYSNDSAPAGPSDSITFSYQSFAGEEFSSRASIAKPFGMLDHPDSISASSGYTFKYQNFVPGDSVFISVIATDPSDMVPSFWFESPDTGSFSMTPGQLLYSAKAPDNFYLITVYRIHWDQRLSPGGKRIGVYSEETLYSGFYTKP